MQEEVAKNFFFNKKSGPQCKRGIVMDIVKYNCVSDNFNLTCVSVKIVIKRSNLLVILY